MRRGGVVTVLAVAVLCAVLATPLVQVPGVAATSVGTNDVVEVDIRSGGSIHDAGGVASGEADAATSTEVKADSGKRTGKKRRRKGKKKKQKKNRRRRKKPMHLGSDTLVRTEEMDENGNFPSMTAGGRKKMPPSAMQAKMKTRNAMMPVFMCTACERTANDVSHALSRRHFAGDVWSSETRFAVWEDIRGLCVNPKLFPSEGSLYIDGCVKFLTDYSSKVCVCVCVRVWARARAVLR